LWTFGTWGNKEGSRALQKIPTYGIKKLQFLIGRHDALCTALNRFFIPTYGIKKWQFLMDPHAPLFQIFGLARWFGSLVSVVLMQINYWYRYSYLVLLKIIFLSSEKAFLQTSLLHHMSLQPSTR
jgi:hypothetical protein